VQSRSQPGVSLVTRFIRWVQRVLTTTRGRLILAGAVLAIATLVVGVLRLRGRRPAVADDPPAVLTSSLLTAFARLEAALATDGRARAPAETLAELERRLAVDDDSIRALATFQRSLYAPGQVPAADTRAATHTFEQLAATILSAHAAREKLAASIGVRR
jgi:hypothetical protein